MMVLLSRLYYPYFYSLVYSVNKIPVLLISNSISINKIFVLSAAEHKEKHSTEQK